MATVITAAGIDADTVMPTRRPRYALAAPKTMPSTTPVTTAFSVNSASGSAPAPGSVWFISRPVGGREKGIIVRAPASHTPSRAALGD